MIVLSQNAKRECKQAANKVEYLAKFLCRLRLRPYQREAANAIIESVFARDGETFVIIFARQSGKDEMLAIVLLFLLGRFADWGADMVMAQPTFKPQTINAMERLKKRGAYWGRRLSRTAGYIIRFGQARVSYFSGEPTASQVGATAERLLIMNEAQDILPGVYDKRFLPMASSGNATKVFSGTSWTSNTLLAREKRAAEAMERKDGRKRVFMVTADEVGRVNKFYKKHVEREIARLGRGHPFVKTQYFCEEIDAQAGLFNAARRALMQGDQPGQETPVPGHVYAFLVDVAGQDESSMTLGDDAPLDNPGRDSTTLSIVDVDLSELATLQAPIYRIVKRLVWVGLNHIKVFGSLTALAAVWKPQHVVIDATGVGEGLWSMLDRSMPGKVIPVKFSASVKSELGYMMIAAIETGRLRDCAMTPEVDLQYKNVQAEILPGPQKTMRWSVPEGTRDAFTGELIHDDHVLADALVVMLDKLDWKLSAPGTVLARNIQDEIDGGGY